MSRTIEVLRQELASHGANHPDLMAAVDDVARSHEALQATIREQAVLLDAAGVQLWYLTDVETYGRVNKEHAAFLGRRVPEIEFRPLDDFLPREVAEACRRSNRTLFETNAPVYTEEWVPNARGEARLLAINKVPSLDDEGSVRFVVCTAKDITALRETRMRTLENERNFRAFVETIDDIVVIARTTGVIVYANPAAHEKLGLAPEELGRIRVLDLHPEELRPEAERILQEMFRGERTICPLPLLRRNGAYLPVETRVWHGMWNQEPCIFGLCKDLSREQEALQKFDRLFRSNPALMAVSCAETKRFLDVNDAFLQRLGFSREEVVGATADDLGLFPGSPQQKLVSRMLLEKGSIRNVELRVRARSGELLDGVFSGELISSQGQDLFLTVMIDITARKRADAEREELIDGLTRSLKEIRTLRGLIPICSHCKKIRDDRGYWQQVEDYISAHTDAIFSHGICQGCLRELFPEDADAILRKYSPGPEIAGPGRADGD